jgi:nicotinamidase-related amidase
LTVAEHHPRHALALLLIDVINDFDFPGAESLVAEASRAAPRIASLVQRARQMGAPVIYVNDNFGHWRSDFHATVARCSDPRRPAAALVQRLAPGASDFFVLKPMHSGFFHTPLELLLAELGSQVLILCGFATNSCVAFTAHDAHMRGYSLVVPEDTTAANSPEQCSSALQHLATTVRADTRSSEALRLEELVLRASHGGGRRGRASEPLAPSQLLHEQRR